MSTRAKGRNRKRRRGTAGNAVPSTPAPHDTAVRPPRTYPINPAGPITRLYAWIIDLGLIALLVVAYDTSSGDHVFSPNAAPLKILAFLAYFILPTGIWGRTIGKWVAGIVVVDEKGPHSGASPSPSRVRSSARSCHTSLSAWDSRGSCSTRSGAAGTTVSPALTWCTTQARERRSSANSGANCRSSGTHQSGKRPAHNSLSQRERVGVREKRIVAISSKVREQMQESSWIRRMFEEGIELRRIHGADKVFDLSLGNPILEPPPEFRTELMRIAQDETTGTHRYMPNGGFPETRAAVAQELSAETGLPFTGEDVMMTVGAGRRAERGPAVDTGPGRRGCALRPLLCRVRLLHLAPGRSD